MHPATSHPCRVCWAQPFRRYVWPVCMPCLQTALTTLPPSQTTQSCGTALTRPQMEGNAPLLAALATQAQASHPPVPLAAGAQPVADRAWPEVSHHLRCFVCGLLWFVALVVSLICLVDDFWLTNLHHEPRSHWLLVGAPLVGYSCMVVLEPHVAEASPHTQHAAGRQ